MEQESKTLVGVIAEYWAGKLPDNTYIPFSGQCFGIGLGALRGCSTSCTVPLNNKPGEIWQPKQWKGHIRMS